MKVMFWNVRGLGKSYRRSLVKNHVIQEDLDAVALQETIKSDFVDWELKEMAGNKDFVWSWIPAKGHSGGLLTGVKTDILEIEETVLEDCFISILVRHRVTNVRYWIVNVYGSAQHVQSPGFIQDLSSFCRRETLPILMGGDFNLIRCNGDRNQGQGEQKLMDLFNGFISEFQLREIFISGSRFTWSNKQKNPIMVKLDRVLASEEWESKFPTCFAWTKARIGSDHCPIILNSGENGQLRPRYFFFEDAWFQGENFYQVIQDKWLQFKMDNKGASYSLDIWHGCMQNLRKYLRGWNLKSMGDQRNVKTDLTKRIQDLDSIAETRLLSILEWEERIDLEDKLEKIAISENLYWKQRAGTKWVLQGDTNSHFYHQFANGRRRKNTITIMTSDDGEIRGQQEIIVHIVEFYKKLFGPNEESGLVLGGNFWPECYKLSENMKRDLVKDFEFEEVKQVIMSLKENSAPGPNGFGPGFFKKCWEVYKQDLYSMFQDFHKGDLDIKRLNFGVITLVPKLKEANTIKQYRPICLLNVDYKCFTKLLTNRLVPVAQKIIGENQTGFIKGRNILEGVLVLHEVLHELRRSKKQGLVLKIDFEKAYDRVNWNFLEQVMKGKGFPVQWITWVMSTVRGGGRFVLM